jgi:hypothetical protein
VYPIPGIFSLLVFKIHTQTWYSIRKNNSNQNKRLIFHVICAILLSKEKQLDPACAGRTTMADLQPIPPEENMTPVDGGAYISERFRDPGATKAAAPAGNYTLAGVFSIIAFILFIAMLILLYQDWVELSAA